MAPGGDSSSCLIPVSLPPGGKGMPVLWGCYWLAERARWMGQERDHKIQSSLPPSFSLPSLLFFFFSFLTFPPPSLSPTYLFVPFLRFPLPPSFLPLSLFSFLPPTLSSLPAFPPIPFFILFFSFLAPPPIEHLIPTVQCWLSGT